MSLTVADVYYKRGVILFIQSLLLIPTSQREARDASTSLSSKVLIRLIILHTP